MGSIQILEPAVADRIAAGEVVERPASVVRELLDNAIDAGASRVAIELEAGGLERIVVSDDGWGLSPDDARLAFERHATSKIRSGSDLEHIRTLGFRGEALAAIAAVARVEMITRTAEADVGTRVVVDHGAHHAVDPASRARGTTVRVERLFGAVPARRKFLKTAGTEQEHVRRAVQRISLARPELGLHLSQKGKALVSLPPDPAGDARIRSVLGQRVGEALVPVVEEAGTYAVRAWAGRWDLHRHDRNGIQLFVNRRPVRDPLLLRVITDAYRPRIPARRFPVVVLFLELPEDEVDVNVHPAKSEVRFHQPRQVRALVSSALSKALGTREATPMLGGGAVPRPGSAQAFEWSSRAGGDRVPSSAPGAREATPLPWDAGGAEAAARAGTSGDDAAGATPRPLAQFRNTFILAEDGRGLLIVDQHVAHERILYEELARAQDETGPARQALLAARPLELDAHQRDLLAEHRTLIEHLGFRVESFGDEAVRVREVPALAGRPVQEDALLAVLERLDQGDTAAAADLFDHLLATIACHSAVRKGDPLTLEKMAFLLGGLDKCEAPSHCPHGRRISMRVDLSVLNSQFDRG
jgi:DNA mismatch repair protein MutL